MPEERRLTPNQIRGLNSTRTGRAIIRTDHTHERPGELAFFHYNPHRGEYSITYEDNHSERADRREGATVAVLFTADELLEEKMRQLRGAEPCLEEFVVASVSTNTNSFGLYGHILISREGNAFEVGASGYNKRKKGDTVKVRWLGCEYYWGELGFEIGDRKPTPPKEVIEELFKNAGK